MPGEEGRKGRSCGALLGPFRGEGRGWREWREAVAADQPALGSAGGLLLLSAAQPGAVATSKEMPVAAPQKGVRPSEAAGVLRS